MIKKNKWHLILSSFIILLPLFFGVLFPERVAELFPAVFGQENAMNTTFVFILPLILLAVQWICVLVTCLDPKSRAQGSRILPLVLWIIPAITIIMMITMSFMAKGGSFKIFMLLPAFMGILFIVLGNYMPKIRQNHTMGLKIKWTLESEENWLATHRVAGKTFVLCGLAVLIALPFSLTASLVVLLVAAFATVIVSVLYSYRFYKKQLSEGKIEPIKSKMSKAGIAAYIGGTVVLIAVICAVFLGGNISYSFDSAENAITIDATFHQDLTFKLEDVASAELSDNIGSATRIMGYGSPALSMGTYQSELFGSHTRYTFNQNPCGIVVRDKSGAILVFNCKTKAETEKLFSDYFKK